MQLMPENAIEIIKASDIDSRIKAAREIVASLFEDLRQLNPLAKESGKYLHISVSKFGYRSVGEVAELGLYFGQELNISPAESLDQIKAAISEYDPARIKAKKIESLRSELAALENDQQSALTA